jgi:hypothetical protein
MAQYKDAERFVGRGGLDNTGSTARYSTSKRAAR